MKLRRYLSVLVLTLVMADVSSASEVYNKNGSTLDLFGSFNGGHYLSPDENKQGDRSFLRYGLIGRTCFNDQFVGFGMWEEEINFQYIEGNNNDISSIKDSFVRLGYAGIKYGDFGAVDYGRNYGVLYDVGSWTDVMPEFGGDTSLSDNFLSSRASNVFTYRNVNFFGLVNGLDFALQYQGKNDESRDSGRTVKEANGIGYGVSASYAFDNGISTAAAYTNSKRTVGQKSLIGNTNANNAEAYSVGLKYDDNSLYLAVLYSESRNMIPFGVFENSYNTDHIYGFVDKAKNVELVAQYCFDFGLRPSIGYLHSKANDIMNGYACYLKKYVEVGSIYNLHKNISTTIDYRINLLKKNDFTNAAQISTDNIFAFGMIYTF